MKFANLFNQDFQDLIKEFNEAKVEYLLIDGYLVILNGYNRTTGDLDLWVKATKDNYVKISNAFHKFGLPIQAIGLDKFLDTKNYDVFTFDSPPVSIDLLTEVKGLEFTEAYNASKLYEIEKDFSVRGLSKSDLIKAKRASGRNKDLDDLENIQKQT